MDRKPHKDRQHLLRYVAPALLSLLFLGLPALLFVFSQNEQVSSYVLGLGLVVTILGMAWLEQRFEVSGKEQPWRDLAARTGLRCEVGSWLTGFAVQVVGSYRGRPLTLYTRRQGKGQIPSTRIELLVSSPSGALLRLRGPFWRDEALLDRVTSDLFQATRAQQFGDDQRFFIRSQPVHLATMLVANQMLWERLLQLDALVTIELDGATLVFEQMNVLTDVEQLHRLFELLHDLADMIEQNRHMLSA